MRTVSFLSAIAGLGFSLSFLQTARHRTVNRFASASYLLLFPVLAALLGRIALELGWWTIGIFVAVSFAIGILNGVLLRGPAGKAGLYGMQTTNAMMYMAFASASGIFWMLR